MAASIRRLGHTYSKIRHFKVLSGVKPTPLHIIRPLCHRTPQSEYCHIHISSLQSWKRLSMTCQRTCAVH